MPLQNERTKSLTTSFQKKLPCVLDATPASEFISVVVAARTIQAHLSGTAPLSEKRII